MEVNLISINHEFDSEGVEIEDSYVVSMTGEPADLFGLSEEYFTTIVDANEFAEQASNDTNTTITWECFKPAWAK